ncbi:MAG: sulfite exporter TauE/SafE family protein [Clostridiales bacterium]|jgi:sulfite exporter TauE/SafE/plastocyanin domain-containing protein/copper chaperone CopZ|nr:sulfite exporter TauE/SafE family protein [Clostridiales bacterium]
MDSMKTRTIGIGGMSCASCQSKIERKLQNTAGVESATVNLSAASATIVFDPDIITLVEIETIIDKLGYDPIIKRGKAQTANSNAGAILILVASVFLLMNQMGLGQLFNFFPEAKAGMGYPMLFIIGILTSVHCVAMCGGINLSQCIPKSARKGDSASTLRPSLLYNAGRVASYTIIGGVVGALGSVVTPSGAFRGAIQLIAGVFMVIMGVNMLGIFPWLHKITPRMPKFITRKVNRQKRKSNSPFLVGLLNGLMPCGPLQAMQIYALSTGSVVSGALSMLAFSLGTVPLMFGLGALTTVLGKKFTRNVMTAGAALVVLLGLSMFTQGWTLSGFSLGSIPSLAATTEEATNTNVSNGVQTVNSTLQSGKYPAITVSAGVPVKWVIEAPQGSINGCNNRIIIPEYNIEHQFKLGENVIEFTPTEAGKFAYSCWMGMIRSSITVVDDPNAPAESADSEKPAEYAQAGSSNSEPEDFYYEDDPSLSPYDILPANVKIDASELGIAEMGTIEVRGRVIDVQKVKVELTDEGYSPAVIVVQEGLDVEWLVNNQSQSPDNSYFLVPNYNSAILLLPGENPLYILPDQAFEFSNGDNTFYGYVKVVEDLGSIDEEQIRAEAEAFETLIYPQETYNGASCHTGAQ